MAKPPFYPRIYLAASSALADAHTIIRLSSFRAFSQDWMYAVEFRKAFSDSEWWCRSD